MNDRRFVIVEVSKQDGRIPIGLLVVLYAVSFLTLPAAEAMTHEWAVVNGWIDE